MRAPPFHGNNAVTVSRRRRKAKLRESRGSARIFLNLRDDVRSPLRAVRVMGGQNLIESEERCADASRLQPRVAERGTSILLMARRPGSATPGYSRSLLTHFRSPRRPTAWQADHQSPGNQGLGLGSGVGRVLGDGLVRGVGVGRGVGLGVGVAVGVGVTLGVVVGVGVAVGVTLGVAEGVAVGVIVGVGVGPPVGETRT